MKENFFQTFLFMTSEFIFKFILFGPILVLNRAQNEKGRGIKNEGIG